MTDAPASEPDGNTRIVEVNEERSALAEAALHLIYSTFPLSERQPVEQIAMEIAEKRLGLLTSYDFHLFAALDDADAVMAVASGVYLGGVNAGFITYLAVSPDYQSRGIGRSARAALIEAFRRDARLIDWQDLAAVVGEVRIDSPWLHRLVRDRAVVPLDFEYFHPGQDPSTAQVRWILYRQPFTDERESFPTGEIRQLLYAIWRRAYRVRWPLREAGFSRMLEELEGRAEVGGNGGVLDEPED